MRSVIPRYLKNDATIVATSDTKLRVDDTIADKSDAVTISQVLVEPLTEEGGG